MNTSKESKLVDNGKDYYGWTFFIVFIVYAAALTLVTGKMFAMGFSGSRSPINIETIFETLYYVLGFPMLSIWPLEASLVQFIVCVFLNGLLWGHCIAKAVEVILRDR